MWTTTRTRRNLAQASGWLSDGGDASSSSLGCRRCFRRCWPVCCCGRRIVGLALNVPSCYRRCCCVGGGVVLSSLLREAFLARQRRVGWNVIDVEPSDGAIRVVLEVETVPIVDRLQKGEGRKTENGQEGKRETATSEPSREGKGTQQLASTHPRFVPLSDPELFIRQSPHIPLFRVIEAIICESSADVFPC